MVNLEINQVSQIRVNGSEWVSLPRDEFDLLRYLLMHPEKMVSFSELNRRIWEFDGRHESRSLLLARERLIRIMHDIAPDVDWDTTIRRDPDLGYGMFLKDA